MTISSLKRRMKAATATMTAVATTVVLAAVPHTVSAAEFTTTKTVTHNCSQNVGNITETLTVTAPKEVRIGENFTVKVQPGEMSMPSPSTKLDYRFLVDDGSSAGKRKPSTFDTSSMRGISGTPKFGGIGRIVKVEGEGSEGLKTSGGNFTLPAVNFNFVAEKKGEVSVKIYDAWNGPLIHTLGWQQDGAGLFGLLPGKVHCGVDDAELVTVKILGADEQPTLQNTRTTFISEAKELPAKGGSVDLKAKVTSNGSAVSGGTMTFVSGDDSKTVPVGSDGTATWTTTFPANTKSDPLSYDVTATYNGSSEYTKSQALLSVTVAAKGKEPTKPAEKTKVATTTKLSHSVGTVVPGATNVLHTLRATVSAANGEDLEGRQVVFTSDGKELGAANLDEDGVASMAVPLKAGTTHTVNAEFEGFTRGDNIIQPSKATETIKVESTGDAPLSGDDTANPAPQLTKATVSVTADPVDVSVGGSIKITASYEPGAGNKAGQPVVFRINGVRVGTSTTDDSGTATFDAPILAPGKHTITAVVPQHEADGKTVASAESEPVAISTEQTTDETTTTSLEVSPSGSVALGTPVTLTAAVSGAAGDDAWVSFYDGDKLLGDVKVEGGKASFTFTPADEGSHDLKATFNGAIVGTKDLQASESATTPVTVAKDSTRKSFTVEAPKAAEGPAGGKEGSSLGAAKTPLIIVGVLTGILFIAGIIFLIPDVRKMANLPPIPPLFPVPNMG